MNLLAMRAGGTKRIIVRKRWGQMILIKPQGVGVDLDPLDAVIIQYLLDDRRKIIA